MNKLLHILNHRNANVQQQTLDKLKSYIPHTMYADKGHGLHLFVGINKTNQYLKVNMNEHWYEFGYVDTVKKQLHSRKYSKKEFVVDIERLCKVLNWI